MNNPLFRMAGFAMIPLLSATLSSTSQAEPLAATAIPSASSAKISTSEPAQDAVDIHLAGRLVGRYVTAHDTSTPARRQETYKPFLHIFDPEGRQFITKGTGGEYTHHRGIYIGWFKIGFDGKTLDRWHMIGGEQVVQGKVESRETPASSIVESTVHWNDAGGEPFIVEKRTFTFRTPQSPAYVLVDFQSRLQAPRGDVTLDGDPEHAGIHFRPTDSLVRKETVYLFPGTKTDAHKALDLAWIGEQFVADGRTYSVIQFNHPENPSGTKSSAYRDYGRLGMYPHASIASGDSLVLRYRFLVSEGAFPEASMIQAVANDFTGRNDPVPPVTRRAADVPPPPKAKQTKPPKTPKS